MDRNLELEERIYKRMHTDTVNKINSYGGMGMDCAPSDEKKLRLEEIDYMRKHPEIFRKNKPDNKSIYLINLN